MNTRLTINVRDGLLEAEGSEDFVRSIYNDFREQVSKVAALKTSTLERMEQPQLSSKSIESLAPKPNGKTRRKASEGSKAKAAEYKPAFRNHDLAGLGEFYDAFSPANHNEKILCFAVYLRDKLSIAPCHADDIFTCYFTMKDKTKTPEAYAQAFITAKNRTHYIEFEWPHKIEVTIAGNNFFNERRRKAGTAK